MRQRWPFLLLIGLLIAGGVLTAFNRHQTYGIPFTPSAEQRVWQVEARVQFNARGNQSHVYLALPPLQDGFSVVDSNYASSGFGLDILKGDGQERAHWTKRDAAGPPSADAIAPDTISGAADQLSSEAERLATLVAALDKAGRMVPEPAPPPQPQRIIEAREVNPEDRLRRFIGNYPGSPLLGDAWYWLGESQSVRGNHADAASSYLKGFQSDTQGQRAAHYLYRLGATLGRLGQLNEACLTLREVRNRFPNAPDGIPAKADAEADALTC